MNAFYRELLKAKNQTKPKQKNNPKHRKPTLWLAAAGGIKASKRLTEAKNMQLAGAF